MGVGREIGGLPDSTAVMVIATGITGGPDAPARIARAAKRKG
jgi:putative effector of murein hydrolase